MKRNDPHQNGSVAPTSERMKNNWKPISGWSIKGPILLLAVFFGIFGDALNVGPGAVAAGFAMLIPIIVFRPSWNELRFWITVILLGAAQVPLVMRMNPMLDRSGFASQFAFGTLDCALVVIVIWWVCSASKETIGGWRR